MGKEKTRTNIDLYGHDAGHMQDKGKTGVVARESMIRSGERIAASHPDASPSDTYSTMPPTPLSRSIEKEYAGSYKKLSSDVRAQAIRQEEPVPTSGQAPTPPVSVPVAKEPLQEVAKELIKEGAKEPIKGVSKEPIKVPDSVEKYPDSNPPKVQLPSKGKEPVPVDKKAANGKGTIAVPSAPPSLVTPTDPVTAGGGDEGPTSEQQDWAADYRSKKLQAHKSWQAQDTEHNPT